MSEVENDLDPDSKEKVRLSVKADVENHAMMEAMEESTADAANNMTLDQNSSMRAMGLGSISVIAGKLSEIVPRANESVPFE